MDKYGVEQDAYCYPNSDVLKNRLSIKDAAELTDAERDITAAAAEEIEFEPPPYSLATLRRVHRLLFRDIYDWAGECRSVDIAKGETRFCTAQRIEPEAKKLFDQLAGRNWLEGLSRYALVRELAEFYGELNMVHPFREGNGRAQRLLFEFLIVNAGYEIRWEPVTEKEWQEANIQSALRCDSSGLEAIFEKCIGRRIPD
ncbi:cell filamentation protein [Tamilnaduibacter salinus]|uniref:protein adenylyltransferase n=1 Tax=Tamilnaduibacter salinus TaxID=1484056 RepID=A0A2U1CXB7_9GAMM|nr:putative adenosine monophosphate-protein transferase Fic [Tamilnaduibacter salinus]PVY76858.1 cell filamentation protein [Tamilnaduibacter salinus]